TADCVMVTMPDDDISTLYVMSFTWPDIRSSIVGACFWTAIVRDGELVCGFDYAPWMYSPL
ncbi:hypothetical protein JXA80_00570, partial [bacterium]|nr:hypothetical protein [candidate division CSSED10-310 bacterium]